MSLTTAILIFDQTTLDAMRVWTAGSHSGRTMVQVGTVAPCGRIAHSGPAKSLDRPEVRKLLTV